MQLDIGNDIKSAFARAKTIGKLIPIILELEQPEQIQNFTRIAAYKMNLK